MKLSVITPTADRPEAFALCERWIARQTRPPDEWVVIDDGATPIAPTLGQVHVRRDPGAPGHESFARNLQAGVDLVTGDVVAIIEDDDYYQPWHLADLVERLGQAALAGSIWQPYYNLRRRLWKIFENRGASLCQTGLRRELLPLLTAAIEKALASKSYGIDGALWASALEAGERVDNPDTFPTIGIKGLSLIHI